VEKDYKHLHHCFEGKVPEVEVTLVYEKCTKCLRFTTRDVNNMIVRCHKCDEKFCSQCGLTDNLFHKLAERFYICQYFSVL
jgi:hypothetical protein